MSALQLYIRIHGACGFAHPFMHIYKWMWRMCRVLTHKTSNTIYTPPSMHECNSVFQNYAYQCWILLRHVSWCHAPSPFLPPTLESLASSSASRLWSALRWICFKRMGSVETWEIQDTVTPDESKHHFTNVILKHWVFQSWSHSLWLSKLCKTEQCNPPQSLRMQIVGQVIHSIISL